MTRAESLAVSCYGGLSLTEQSLNKIFGGARSVDTCIPGEIGAQKKLCKLVLEWAYSNCYQIPNREGKACFSEMVGPLYSNQDWVD